MKKARKALREHLIGVTKLVDIRYYLVSSTNNNLLFITNFWFPLDPEEHLSFKTWANLFNYTFLFYGFCLLLHRLAVRISLPFYIYILLVFEGRSMHLCCLCESIIFIIGQI